MPKDNKNQRAATNDTGVWHAPLNGAAAVNESKSDRGIQCVNR
jgi:hypothetical protein